MKLEIKYWHSPDIYDLWSYKPKEPNNFGFLLQVMVGPADQDVEESFDIMVCTPQWLLAEYKENDILFARHHLIVFRYDFPAIQKKIEDYCEEHCVGDTWEEIAEKLARIGRWEFEDYQEYDGS
jgi:hypothetical protein